MLAGLAANVMAQPSGRVYGIHSKHRIYLRSSPFICAIDGLSILLQLSYYTYRGDTPRNAAHRILQGRFVDGGENGGDDKGSIEWNKAIRVILFAVGMLPAVIKLYTLGGVPWTKTWGSMYLVSFLLMELLLLVAGKQEPEPALQVLDGPDISKNLLGSELFGRISLLSHFTCLRIIVTFFFNCSICLPSYYMCIRLFILFTSLIITCEGFLVVGLVRASTTRDTSTSFLFGFVAGALGHIGVTSFYLWNDFLKSWPADILGTSPLGFYFITLSVISITLALFFPIISKIFYQILFLITLTFALTYYIMIFDSCGTTDPSWLELLG